MNACRFAVAVLLLAGCSAQQGADSTQKQLGEPSKVVVRPDDAAAPKHFNWHGGDGTITDLMFSPDDSYLVVSLAPKGEKVQRHIIVLRFADARETYRFESLWPTSICFSPDGSRLATLAADELTIHDLGKKEIMVCIDRETFGSDIQSLGFSADGAVLVGAAEYLDLKEKQVAWNPTTGEKVGIPAASIIWHGDGLSKDGSMFFGGGWPGPTPRIYKTDRTDRITYCYRRERPIAAAFTPDSKNFVTIHDDGLLVVWEIEPTGNDNAKQLMSRSGFDGCRTFAVSNDQKRIATAEKDGSIQIRDFPADAAHAMPR
jgi:WD40 repeat protein